MAIYRIATYVDSKGREIHERTEVTDNVLALGPVTYVARVNGQVTTPHGPQEIPLLIDITAKDITEAYAEFDKQVPRKAQEAMAKAIEDMKAHYMRQRLAQGAHMMPPGGG